MHSLILNGRSGRLLMGGMQNKLVEFDLATGKETRVSLILMLPVSLVFHTEATVSIGLKNVLRVGTSIL